MFALLRTSAGMTMPQITADIIGLLTGTITTTAGLSASCDAVNSKVVSIDPAGWTVADALAGAVANTIQPKVIQSPWADSATDFKNILISSPFVNQLVFNGFHTWNPTTHTGTLPHVLAPVSASWQTLNPVAGEYILISASASHFLIVNYGTTALTAFPTINQGTSQTVACFEYSRDDAWSTVANGYPSWCTVGDYLTSNVTTISNGCISKMFNPGTMLDVNQPLFTNYGFTPAVEQSRSFTVNVAAGGLSNVVASYDPGYTSVDANKAAVFPAYPLALRHAVVNNTNFPTMSGGTFLNSNVLACGSMWNCGDEVDIGTQRYFRAIVGYPSLNLLIKEA